MSKRRQRRLVLPDAWWRAPWTWRRATVRAAIETLLIVSGLFANWFWLPHASTQADAGFRLRDLTALLEHGVLTNDRYSLIGPLFSTPLWLLGRINQSPAWWLARYNLILFAVALLLIYLLMRAQVEGRVLRPFLLLLTVASMFPNALENYYGEVFTALCVGVGIIAAVVGGRRTALAGWLAVAVGVTNAPASLAGLALAVVARCLRRRRWRYVLAIAGAAGLVGAEAWLRRGSPFTTGYAGDHGYVTVMPFSGRPGFSYPFLFGLLAILLSFGKGLLFYAPGIVLPMRAALGALRRVNEIYLLWLAFVAGLVLIYASWWSWYGGWTWGPRFFLFASLPASLALALRLRCPASSLLANVLTLVVLAVSCWVGLNGAVFGQTDLAPTCLYNNFAQEQLCWFTPEFSALWHPLVVAAQTHWHWSEFASREQLGPAAIAYCVYSGVAFVYLALPLVRTVALQVWSEGRDWIAGSVRPTLARF